MARTERSADLPESGEHRDAAETARPRFGAFAVSSERLGSGVAVVSVAGEVVPNGGARPTITLMGLDRAFALHESRASALGGAGA